MRQHRRDVDSAWIEREHRIIDWAGDAGIPVVHPLRSTEGSTVFEAEGGQWATFPWIHGNSVRRKRITIRQALLLGDLHGRTQVAMRGQPDASGPSGMRWDTTRAVAVVESLLVRLARENGPERLRIALAWQLACLESGLARSVGEFAHLPVQALHMDFHDQQVIWDKGEIVALVDWEMAGANPRVYELLRALNFSLLLRDRYLEAYVTGFARYVRLSEAECYDGVELWWQTRLHDTWAITEMLTRGNRRVAPFLARGYESSMHLAEPDYRRELGARMWNAAR